MQFWEWTKMINLYVANKMRLRFVLNLQNYSLKVQGTWGSPNIIQHGPRYGFLIMILRPTTSIEEASTIHPSLSDTMGSSNGWSPWTVNSTSPAGLDLKRSDMQY